MNPFFYVAMALGVGAIAVTVRAVLSAPDGFEDNDGFHAVRPQPVREQTAPTDGRGESRVYPLHAP